MVVSACNVDELQEFENCVLVVESPMERKMD